MEEQPSLISTENQMKLLELWGWKYANPLLISADKRDKLFMKNPYTEKPVFYSITGALSYERIKRGLLSLDEWTLFLTTCLSEID